MSSSQEKQAEVPLRSSSLTLTDIYSASKETPRLEAASIELLFYELNVDQSGSVTRRTIEQSILEVYKSLAPTPKAYHLIHPSRTEDWTLFLDSLFPAKNSNKESVFNKDQFISLVHSWNLPSVQQASPHSSTSSKTEKKQSKWWEAKGRISQILQHIRTRCSTSLHRYIFILFVLCLIVSLALWQFFEFFKNTSARAAFGSGVLIAKAASGALYPTLTLMVFSMSRWTQHFLRQSRYLRRFVDWEYAQSFHIKMACLSFLLGIIHAIAHLTGTYRHGLQHPQALAFQLSQMKSETTIPSTYLGFMKWRASWTGLTALGIFTIMFVTSMPKIRRRYFELFQWTHLLMYPLYAMLLVHGSSAILKQPILGWWLLLPLLLVVTEKLYRFYRGFIPLEATVQLAEDNMVALSIKVRNKLSRFRPGQYIYLQIPSISVFQWHPFTVSKITQDSIVIHIRTSAGNWTSSLTSTIDQTEGDQDGIKRFKVAMEGPYGSPSREFYRYNDTIIFGAGIGITPFSAILFDLFDKLNDKKSPWIDDAKNVQRQQKHHKKVNLSDTSTSSQGISIADAAVEQGRVNSSSDDQLLRAILEKRSISLHWTVKTSQDLQWLSLLLNQLSSNLSVKINIHLYVTQSDKDQSISTLIYRSLLDHHRVASIEQKTSVLTGLIQTCHFARPDLEAILDDYHRAYCSMEIHQRLRKVGVIYCGPISIGRVLSRKCQYLTSQARAESARLRYYYHSESF